MLWCTVEVWRAMNKLELLPAALNQHFVLSKLPVYKIFWWCAQTYLPSVYYLPFVMFIVHSCIWNQGARRNIFAFRSYIFYKGPSLSFLPEPLTIWTQHNLIHFIMHQMILQVLSTCLPVSAILTHENVIYFGTDFPTLSGKCLCFCYDCLTSPSILLLEFVGTLNEAMVTKLAINLLVLSIFDTSL